VRNATRFIFSSNKLCCACGLLRFCARQVADLIAISRDCLPAAAIHLAMHRERESARARERERESERARERERQTSPKLIGRSTKSMHTLSTELCDFAARRTGRGCPQRRARAGLGSTPAGELKTERDRRLLLSGAKAGNDSKGRNIAEKGKFIFTDLKRTKLSDHG